MRALRVIVLPLVVFMFAAACAAEDEDGGDGGDGGGGGPTQAEDTGTVNVLSAGDPAEVEAYNAILEDMVNAETEYVAEIEASGEAEQQAQIRAEAGTLDIFLAPQPGLVADLARAGSLSSLEDMGFDIAELESLFGEYFVSLGEVDGQHYGIPTNINLKSMVWYPKDDFDAAGYEVPTTWDDMLALSDQIMQDGGTPWCVGYQSEGSTGWPATDWMEDIMLRTAGPEVYDQWVNHEIPFNDASVVTAGETFGEIMFTEGYVLGGADQTPSIAFGDAPGPMFEDPPNCWLHRQASFIPAGVEAGVDYDWFSFPPIDQEGTLFAGEVSAVFRDAPEVRDFIEKFSGADVQCAQGGEPRSSRISPHVDVGPDCYANEELTRAADVLNEALNNDTARFDASDLMPPAVGSGGFWTGMIEYIQQGPDSLQG